MRAGDMVKARRDFAVMFVEDDDDLTDLFEYEIFVLTEDPLEVAAVFDEDKDGKFLECKVWYVSVLCVLEGNFPTGPFEFRWPADSVDAGKRLEDVLELVCEGGL